MAIDSKSALHFLLKNARLIVHPYYTRNNKQKQTTQWKRKIISFCSGRSLVIFRFLRFHDINYFIHITHTFYTCLYSKLNSLESWTTESPGCTTVMCSITSDSVNLSQAAQLISAIRPYRQNFGENLRYGETISLTPTIPVPKNYTRDIESHCEIHLCTLFYCWNILYIEPYFL